MVRFSRYLHIFLFFLIVFGVVATSSLPTTALAQGCDPEEGYCPLEPIEGLTTEGGQPVDLGGFFQNLFAFAIASATVLSVLMIVVGGFQYMTSESVGNKGAAKRRIQNAVLGLLLALGSWLILNTINPNLLNLDIFAILPEGDERGTITEYNLRATV